MPKKVRWGILGAANIARQQMIPAIEQSENGWVHAIASRSGKAKEFASEFDIPHVFKDYNELIQFKEIDAVYIALPNSLHREWIEKAVFAGKHVLCEKPIVMEENELSRIFDFANEQKVHVMEAFMYRFHPQIGEAKKMLNEKIIGEILTIRSRFHFTIENKQKDIRMQRSLGGGVIWDIGCYSLNAMLEFSGEELAEVQVMTGRKDQVDTHISFQLGFRNSVLGIADCSFYGPMTQGIDIIGTKGIMSLPYVFRPDLNEDRGVIELRLNEEIQQFEFTGNSYVYQVNAFQNAIYRDTALPYTQQQMLQHTRVLQKIAKGITREGEDCIGANHIRT